jgi:hypothetical protein
LSLELRRNPMAWMVLPLAALFWFDTYQTVMRFPPFWYQRAMIMQTHVVSEFMPFAAGLAAWTGSRDSRCRTTDLVTTTARPRWAARLTTWAATTCWALASYLGCVGVLYGVTAHQGAWGPPPWWPVLVGVAAVAASCALGFAAGALLPSRLTPPLAATVVFAPLEVAFQAAVHHDSIVALIAPVNDTLGHKPDSDIGLFSPYLPDLSIAQTIFLVGLTIAALGLLGLPAASSGTWLRRTCAAVTVAGLVAAATGAGLISAARKDAHGMVIPALHNAADDRPTGYTPVCGQAVVPVCVHPAFRADLRAVMAAVGPVFNQVAGLPGAPVRVTQIQTGYFLEENGFGDADMRAGTETISGNPPVLFLPLADLPETSWAAGATDGSAVSTTMLRSQIAPAVVTNVIGGRPGRQGGPAQQAIETALLMVSGTPRTPTCSYGACAMAKRPPAAGTSIYAAAQRFAALPATTRHAWLQTHVAALRAGHLTLGQLP